MHDTRRTANLLGAAALAVTDLTLGGATAAAGVSGSGAAALVVLSADPGISVTELGRRVGLTQSAAARMVDALEARGLVERRPTLGKWVAVHPTEAGRAASAHLLDARGERLAALVGTLPPADQEALAHALDRLLRALYAEVGSSELVCRLCDRTLLHRGGRDLSGGSGRAGGCQWVKRSPSRAALCFGIVDFVSALLARRVHSAAVALVAQLGGTALILAAALLLPAPSVTAGALGWGALSGIGTGIGVAFLFRGMANGQLSVVVPLSDVAGVVLPVLFGVLLLGERPSMLCWLGIAAAAPALWLITGAGRGRGSAAGSADGLLSGFGFALQFIALVPVDPAAGLWPLVREPDRVGRCHGAGDAGGTRAGADASAARAGVRRQRGGRHPGPRLLHARHPGADARRCRRAGRAVPGGPGAAGAHRAAGAAHADPGRGPRHGRSGRGPDRAGRMTST